MKRPLYETPDDKIREEAVIKEICNVWHCEARALEKNSYMDFEIVTKDGVVRAICELKCRSNTHDKYPTYMISKMKIERGRMMAKEREVPAILFVHFEDDIMFLDMSEVPDHTSIGGRSDRNDPLDTELVNHYRIDQLTTIYE